MLHLEGSFFLFILLWKSGFGAHEMGLFFFPLTNKPLASEQIFSIQIATAAQCRYICIQNKECLAVLYASSGLLCNGYKSASEEKSLIEDEKVWKVVRQEPCPEGFIWQANVRKCYASRMYQSVMASQIVDICKALHASATPVEPRNQTEMDIVKDMADGQTVWLGMQRRDNSNILDDFVYYSDGKKVNYTDWATGDPNNGANAERCVAANAAINYQWGDVRCSRKYLLVCELSGISK